jgi:hypothetical protein
MFSRDQLKRAATLTEDFVQRDNVVLYGLRPVYSSIGSWSVGTVAPRRSPLAYKIT